MWPFDRGLSGGITPGDGQEYETVTEQKTGEKRYTEHTATARFSDGSERV